MTATGLLTGSPAHIAPEVVAGDTVTASSDLYSLASTVHTLITGSARLRPGDRCLHPAAAQPHRARAAAPPAPVRRPTSGRRPRLPRHGQAPGRPPRSCAAFADELQRARRESGAGPAAYRVLAPPGSATTGDAVRRDRGAPRSVATGGPGHGSELGAPGHPRTPRRGRGETGRPPGAVGRPADGGRRPGSAAGRRGSPPDAGPGRGSWQPCAAVLVVAGAVAFVVLDGDPRRTAGRRCRTRSDERAVPTPGQRRSRPRDQRRTTVDAGPRPPDGGAHPGQAAARRLRFSAGELDGLGSATGRPPRAARASTPTSASATSSWPPGPASSASARSSSRSTARAVFPQTISAGAVFADAAAAAAYQSERRGPPACGVWNVGTMQLLGDRAADRATAAGLRVPRRRRPRDHAVDQTGQSLRQFTILAQQDRYIAAGFYTVPRELHRRQRSWPTSSASSSTSSSPRSTRWPVRALGDVDE